MQKNQLVSRSISVATLVALSSLAACSGLQSSNPSLPQSAALPATQIGASVMGRTTDAATIMRSSHMSPNSAGQNLLYVSDPSAGKVHIYSYHNGSFQGNLSGFIAPYGVCASANDVFVADATANKIFEFAHGGNIPVLTLSDSSTPYGCAADPTSKNLAVANLSTDNVAVYTKAEGTPQYYTTQGPNSGFLFVTYDGSGNLFATTNIGGIWTVEVLPRGDEAFAPVTLNTSINPWSLQWDGQHLAVADQTTGRIDRFKISLVGGNYVGKQVGSTLIAGATIRPDFWVEGSTAIVSDFTTNDVRYFRYPGGGTAMKAIGTFGGSDQVTVSCNQGRSSC